MAVLLVIFIAALANQGNGSAPVTAGNIPQTTTDEFAPTEAAAPATTEPAPAPPPPPIPSPSNFPLSVKILRKACFGSAGCNITYQISPRYTGSASALSGRSLTVIYEVLGGDSGPQINNFTIGEDGSVSVQKEEAISTSSAGITLTAKATSVSLS